MLKKFIFVLTILITISSPLSVTASTEDMLKRAESGNREAQYNLAVSLSNDRKGVEAIKYLILSANQEHAQAQYVLGIAFANGSSVTLNNKTSAEWYKRAADNGHTKAQYEIALRYSSGYGIKQSNELAEKYFKMAYKQGQLK